MRRNTPTKSRVTEEMKRENKLFNTFTKNYDLKKYLESIDEKEIPSVRTP